MRKNSANWGKYFLTAAPYGVGVNDGSGPATIKELINRIVDIIGMIIPGLVALAIVVFLWGVAQSVLNANNEEQRRKGKLLMVYGVITIFVMVSVWGLVEILQNTFF